MLAHSPRRGGAHHICLVALQWINGHAWALWTLPALLLVKPGAWRAHLAVLAGIAWYLNPSVLNALEPSTLNAAFAIP